LVSVSVEVLNNAKVRLIIRFTVTQATLQKSQNKSCKQNAYLLQILEV
jgi:hypothetical protein